MESTQTKDREVAKCLSGIRITQTGEQISNRGANLRQESKSQTVYEQISDRGANLRQDISKSQTGEQI